MMNRNRLNRLQLQRFKAIQNDLSDSDAEDDRVDDYAYYSKYRSNSDESNSDDESDGDVDVFDSITNDNNDVEASDIDVNVSNSDDDASSDGCDGSDTDNTDSCDGSDDEERNDKDDAAFNQPTSWDKCREELVAMLLDNAHDIHLLTGKTKKERCDKIWQKYASQFDQKMVTGSISRYLLKLAKGELKPKALNGKTTKDGKPFWKSRSKSSDGYGLLYKIRLHNPIERLTTREVYDRHKIFHQYAFDDFKRYDKRMIKLTTTHSKQIKIDVEKWQLQRSVTRKTNATSRGKMFWSSHAAKHQLVADMKCGKASEMRPKDLYKSHNAYQDFSLEDFRKHIYQEKYKQLAGPYWQKKRNKLALKEHLKNVERMYSEFLHTNYEETLDAITEGFACM
jgi:hypothetical protein